MVDFDVIERAGVEPDDEGVFLARPRIVGFRRRHPAGFKSHPVGREKHAHRADGDRRKRGIQIDSDAPAVLKSLGLAGAIAEPGGILVPTRAGEDLPVRVEEFGHVGIAQAGLVGISPEEFVGRAEGSAHEKAVHHEPALEELIDLRVGVIGDDGQFRGAAEGGLPQVRIGGALVGGDAEFVFGRGPGQRVVVEQEAGRQFFEPLFGAFAQIDAQVIAHGVEELEQGEQFGAGLKRLFSARQGRQHSSPPPLFRGPAERLLRALGLLIGEGDGGEDDRAHLVSALRPRSEQRGEAAGQGVGFRSVQRGVTPVVNQRHLPGVGGQVRIGFVHGPGSSGAARLAPGRDDAVQSLGKTRFGHHGLALHERFKLHPAHGFTFALALHQPQAPLRQQQARRVGVNHVVGVIGWGGLGRQGQRDGEG